MIMGYKMIHPNRTPKKRPLLENYEETLTAIPEKKRPKKKKTVSSAQSYDKINNKKNPR